MVGHMRRVSRYLNGRLIDICQRTIQLEELNLKLIKYIPVNLQAHCRAGSFTRGCLTIVASDSAWGSQLRYMLPELRDNLRTKAGIYQLSSIKIAIATVETIRSTKRVNANQPRLSTKAREAIQAIGNQCNYLPLKQALQHLAEVDLDKGND